MNKNIPSIFSLALLIIFLLLNTIQLRAGTLGTVLFKNDLLIDSINWFLLGISIFLAVKYRDNRIAAITIRILEIIAVLLMIIIVFILISGT